MKRIAWEAMLLGLLGCVGVVAGCDDTSIVHDFGTSPKPSDVR